MTRYYKTLTKIALEHEYYTGFACPDFDIVPTTETAARIRGHRLLWGASNKNAPSEYTLLAESVGADLGSATALLPLSNTASFCFGMQLKNPNFVNFTVLPPRSNKEVYIFRNAGSSGVLAVELMEIVPGIMQLDGLLNVTVNVLAPEGTDDFTVTPYQNGGSYSALINFAGKPEGVYTIDSSLPDKKVFVSAALSGQDIFGVLYLQKGDGNFIEPSYSYRFEVKEVRWKYFIVLRGDHSNWDYKIQYDEIAPAGDDFSPYNTWTPSDLGTLLAATISLPDTVIGFRSNPAIGYSDVVRSSIALTRELKSGAPGYPSPSPVVVVSNLPNPPLGSATASVVVSVDPPPP